MAKRDNSQGSGVRKLYWILGIIGVLGIAIVGSSLRSGAAVVEPVDLGDIGDEELVELAQGVVYGNPDAPVTIMEFGDYQCPACASFALAAKPQVDLAYIETGQAKLVFHDFPIRGHPHAFVAARAARCAGDQDRYFDYHDAVFRAQPQWSPKSSAVGDFIDIAGDVGLDERAFRRCLESDRFADVVTANQTLGERLGVSSTPTLLVYDGSGPAKRLGGFQFVDVQAAMEAVEGND